MEFTNWIWAYLGFAFAWLIAGLFIWFWIRPKQFFYQSRVRAYREEMEYLEEEHQRLLQKGSESDEQLELVTKENISLSSMLEKRQLLLIERENKIRSFQETKTEFEKKQESLREEIFKKTEYNDYLHQQLVNSKQKLEKFERELEHQMTVNAQLRLQKNDIIPNEILTEKNQEIAGLHNQLAALLPLETEKNSMSNQISELLLEKNRLQGFINDKENEIQEFKNHIQILESECEDCKKENLELTSNDKSAFYDQKVIDKDDEIRLLKLQLDEAKEQVASLGKTQKSVESASAEIEEKIENKEVEVNDSAEKKSENVEVLLKSEPLNTENVEAKEEVEVMKEVKSKEKVRDDYETENIEILENITTEAVKKETDDSSAKLSNLSAESSSLKTSKSQKKKAKLIDDYPEELDLEIVGEKAETNLSEEVLEIETESKTAENTQAKSEKKTKTTKSKAVKVVEKEDIENDKLSIFSELAEPKLPELPGENRARLHLQSPTRIFFYWTMKDSPYEPLFKIFGEGGKDFMLVVKLINLNEKSEEMYPIETQGNWWFDVKSDCKYRAEVGFFSPNRPFIRLMYSNDLETPRLNPSKNSDYSAAFAVSATQFAESLNASGYKQDAIEVAMLGDNIELGDKATENSYVEIIGKQEVTGVSLDEMRFALIALASGIRLDTLRETISPQLFAELNRNYGNLSVENVIEILERNFGITLTAGENNTIGETQQKLSYAVFGLSLINFPQAYSSFNVAKK